MDERRQPCSPEGEEARAPRPAVCLLSSAAWAGPGVGFALFLSRWCLVNGVGSVVGCGLVEEDGPLPEVMAAHWGSCCQAGTF